ncbi:MAG: hypothetical protein NTZ82_03305 [Bacteroidetes bacterium]|nr:hypothetical protein [Bacteroidota bacterium]
MYNASKYRKLFTLFLFLFIVQSVSHAQDCKVLDPNLLGVYTGDCKNGKADGQGKSVGLHSYEGEFKAGLPDGEGIYTDDKGSVYKGQFKKGKREGYGEYIIKNGMDSVLTGYWKKNIYVGLYENPYKVVSKTSMVNTININTQASKTFPTIEVSIESFIGGVIDVHGENPKPTLTGVVFSKGTYHLMDEMTSQQKKNVYIFNNVIYPATVSFRFGTEEVIVDFYEVKNYKVSVVLRN